jgi:hypothetical protein
MFAALLLGLAASIVYLTLALSFQSQRSTVRRSKLRVGGTGDEINGGRWPIPGG